MKIGLLGYYGFGNFGDELFRYVFEEYATEGHEIVTLESVTGKNKSFHATPQERQKFADAVDFFLIGGGDLIRPDNPQINYWFPEYMGKPTALFGVGVTNNSQKEPNKETVDALRAYLTHPGMKMIHVRDVESYTWIKDNIAPKCRLFYSPDMVCALPLLQKRRKLKKNRTPVFGIITRKSAKLDPVHTAKIIATVEHYKALGWKTRSILLGTGSTLEDDRVDFEKRQIVTDEVVVRDSNVALIDDVISCDLLASMKFHGCIAGMIAGVPTISWAQTDKFKNFYKNIGRMDLIAPLGGNQTAKLLAEGIAPLDEATVERISQEARNALGELKVLLAEVAKGK